VDEMIDVVNLALTDQQVAQPLQVA